VSNEPPLILETPDGAAPPSVETMLLNQVAILEMQGNARERAQVARWRLLQDRIADYRRRHPGGPRQSVGTFSYDMPLSPRPPVTSSGPAGPTSVVRR